MHRSLYTLYTHDLNINTYKYPLNCPLQNKIFFVAMVWTWPAYMQYEIGVCRIRSIGNRHKQSRRRVCEEKKNKKEKCKMNVW